MFNTRTIKTKLLLLAGVPAIALLFVTLFFTSRMVQDLRKLASELKIDPSDSFRLYSDLIANLLEIDTQPRPRLGGILIPTATDTMSECNPLRAIAASTPHSFHQTDRLA